MKRVDIRKESVFLLALVFMTPAVAQSLPGAYEVHSSFDDIAHRKPINVQGSGFVISTDGRAPFYLLTAAHVGSGADPYIVAGGTRISLDPAIRLSDSRYDLTIFKLPQHLAGTLTPLARYDSRRSLMIVEPSVLAVWIGNNPRRPFVGARYKSVQHSRDGAFVLKGDWVADTVRTVPEDLTGGTHDDRLRIHLLNTEIWAPISIVQGMSGAPLIDRVTLPGENLMIVRGVASQFDRFFNGSYYASDFQVFDLIKNISERARGEKSAARWYYRDGFSFRVISGSTVEAHFKRQMTLGERARLNTGNGSRAEGGNGSRADGGHATHTVSNDVLSGISENGQQILGWQFRLDGLMRQLGFFIYADNLGLFARDGGDLPAEPIPADSSFSELLANRFLSIPQFISERPVWERSRQLQFQGQDHSPGSSIRAKLRIRGSRITLEINGLGRSFSFSINDRGSEVTSNEQSFQEIITVPANGTSYIIDTRSLYFVNFRALQVAIDPADRFRGAFNDRVRRSELIGDRMVRAIDWPPSIRLRNVDSNTVHEIFFDQK